MIDNEFKEFLDSDRTNCSVKDCYDVWRNIVKLPSSNNIDILYVSDSWDRSNKPLQINKDLKYAGFYDKVNKQLYGLSYDLKSILNVELTDYKSMEFIKKDLGNKLNSKYNEYLKQNEDKLFSMSKALDILEDSDMSFVVKSFLDGNSPENIDYNYGYKYSILNNLASLYKVDKFPTDEQTINYIMKGDDYVKSVFNDFVDNCSELMMAVCVRHKKDIEEISKIQNDKSHPLHYKKAILDIVKDKDYKTVNVTIDKNNIEMSFKLNTQELKSGRYYSQDCSLSNYYIQPLAQREEFQKNYGRFSDFTYKDITQISYGRKVIYERGNLEQQLNCKPSLSAQITSAKAETTKSNENNAQERVNDKSETIL